MCDVAPAGNEPGLTGFVCWLTLWCYGGVDAIVTTSRRGGIWRCLSCVSGHEFPFSIQMSHVRHNQGGGGGLRDAAASPADRQEAMQVEQMQAYKQCQFILKPRPTETMHVSAGEVRPELARKSFKRRRSLITWAFWKGSSSHLNELSLGVSRGCLFGQPLSCVCVEDALPKPVMVSEHIPKLSLPVWIHQPGHVYASADILNVFESQLHQTEM